MPINVFSPVLLGFNDGHRILRVELACFGALFLLGFVPLGLVQAWMVLNSGGELEPLCGHLSLVFCLHMLVSPYRFVVIKLIVPCLDSFLLAWCKLEWSRTLMVSLNLCVVTCY